MKTKNFFSTLLTAIIGGALVVGFQYFTNLNRPQPEVKHVIQQVEVPVRSVNFADGTAGMDFSLAAKNSLNTVVHVKTTIQQDPLQSPLLDFIFGPNTYTPPPIQGSGSGVIISSDGYVVTNNHVIDKSDYIEVVLNDKRSFKAKLIGTDPKTDIALLKIDAKDLTPIDYGNSDDIKVGDWVLAVGNPFNLTSTVTAGIISAKGRNINLLNERSAIESFIQTDAAVNPGNSGGALVDSRGQLIGINTAIASATGYFSGYSFAIPVNMVKKIVADIIEFGEVQRAFLGAQISDIDAKLAEELELENLSGVYVNDVTENGAAKEAGIEPKDVIIKVGDIEINKLSELQEQLSKFRPGESVVVTVLRGDKLKEFEVTLKNKYGTTKIIRTSANTILGASFEEITEEDKTKLNITHGVKVAELSAGKLLKAGVQEGFIILEINRTSVKNFEDIDKTIKNSKGGIYIEGIYPNGIVAYYAFGLR